MASMRKLKPENFFKNGKALIREEAFAVLKSKRTYQGAFANICDGRETTVIIEQSRYQKKDVWRAELGWKVITFDMVLPFGLVGFLAAVSGELAKAGISIFAVSAYSTDHVLIKKRDLKKAVACLKKLGLRVELC
jgi:hypothetical protein